MTTGPWPYVTSTDTSSAQLAADAGVPASSVRETILVARTFPIRVAGESGPLPGELTWAEVGVEPEITTVTKKVRRVGKWDAQQVRHAVWLNEPCSLVVTFVDYVFPECKNRTAQLDPEVLSWVRGLSENEVGVPLLGFSTGPDAMVWL